MNKVSLLMLGKKLQDDNLYLLSIHDLEPSGVIVHAYDQAHSKEYTLPISEYEVSLLFLIFPLIYMIKYVLFQFSNAAYSRQTTSLQALIDTIEIVPQGTGFVLQSSNEMISKIKPRLTGAEIEKMLKEPLGADGITLNELMVKGLVELTKAKPVDLDAVKWLGEWFLANNPVKPNVDIPEDE